MNKLGFIDEFHRTFFFIQDGEYRAIGNSSKGHVRSNSSDRINSMSPVMNGHGRIVNGGGLPADISKELEKRNIGKR